MTTCKKCAIASAMKKQRTSTDFASQLVTLNLKAILLKFHQHVKFATRSNAVKYILMLLFCSIFKNYLMRQLRTDLEKYTETMTAYISKYGVLMMFQSLNQSDQM